MRIHEVKIKNKKKIKKCKVILNILHILLTNFPEYKHNSNRLTPFELAQTHEDHEVVYILYTNYLENRSKKTEIQKKSAKEFLENSQNFSLEMKWEVNVPLLSYFCPNDTCLLTKYKENVRMDYSFIEFKKISAIRSPTSWLFLGKNLNVHLTEWEKKTFFNPFENFEEDEKKLILAEMLNSNRVNADFKLKNCEIKESKSTFTKKPVFEKINGYNAKKYEVNITTFVNLHNKEKFMFEKFTYENYFDEIADLGLKIVYKEDNKEIKKNMVNNLKVDSSKMKKELMKIQEKGDKKLKAYIWVVEDYPIKSSVFLLIKLYDFLLKIF